MEVVCNGHVDKVKCLSLNVFESPGLCIELIDEFCVDSGVKTGKQGG